jgi:hypothetical protein
MKTRKGFVSNSSSSSFICDISGETESGYDMCLSDAGMVKCINEHTFIYDRYPDVVQWLDDIEYEDYYSVPEDICPICNGKTKPEIIKRLKAEMKRLNISVDDLK